jgi:hypothetical protein
MLALVHAHFVDADDVRMLNSSRKPPRETGAQIPD